MVVWPPPEQAWIWHWRPVHPVPVPLPPVAVVKVIPDDEDPAGTPPPVAPPLPDEKEMPPLPPPPQPRDQDTKEEPSTAAKARRRWGTFMRAPSFTAPKVSSHRGCVHVFLRGWIVTSTAR